MHHNDEMALYYNLRAPEYEQIYFRDNPPRRKEIDDEAARLRALARDKSVVDLPCGTGYWTEIIAETARDITASDLSAEMLQEAARKSYNVPVTFVRADINHLPFASRSFDLVALGFWFSHHPRQGYPKLLASLSDLLRPDGKIWMVENNPPAEGPELQSTGKDEHGNNFKERFLDNGRRFVILKNYFTEIELRQIFEPHFRIERLTYGQYYWSVVLTPLP